MAQTHICAWHFAWQAWHKLTSTVVLHGRRGTNSHPPSFCVAGVALMALGGALGPDLSPVTPRLFAWQAWYLVTSTFISRGRHGTNSHPPSFCVAGVVLGDIHLHFSWQAWHKLTSTVVLRGMRGTYGIPSFCVAGVALMALGGALGPDLSPVTPQLFAWQAWYLVTSTFISRGRRGTNSHPPSFCVAGVALTGIHLRFAWQAWHLWHWVARLVRILSPVTPRLFAWQAWYLVTSTFISRGRCGTNSHPPSFCVAGVALTGIHLRFAWQAWHLWHWVAGSALGPDLSPVTPRLFARQAWHLVTSTFISRGRRGTNSHPPSFCVAGVALMGLGGALGPDLSPVTPRPFAWLAWHLVTSTFVSHGRRGTISHPPSFCVAGVAPSLTHPLSHTTLSHTIFHTPLCHTPSFTTPSSTHHFVTTLFFTHNFVTHYL